MVPWFRVGLLAGAALVVMPAFAVPALLSGEAAPQLQDQTQISPTNDLPNPYERVHPWGELPTGLYDERASFIGAEQGPDGNICGVPTTPDGKRAFGWAVLGTVRSST